ncbi:MAG TPA: cytidine deaminase [Candidatus Dormibacteraeota bacterium]|jgi:homotetrameric cytidine deaminase|nr:cytidine deaminase [Candidatus Dormibacteraeota bacterium]
MPKELDPELRERLLREAEGALDRSYAPYSSFHVGAAILTGSGRIQAAANVECASYGLSCCAERSAIFAAVAAEGPDLRIDAVAVATRPAAVAAPCGACRQVIWEFGREAVVLYPGEEGVCERTIAELLPAGFIL